MRNMSQYALVATGSESTWYAVVIAWNLSMSSRSDPTLSGWHWSASLLYAFCTSARRVAHAFLSKRDEPPLSSA